MYVVDTVLATVLNNSSAATFWVFFPALNGFNELYFTFERQSRQFPFIFSHDIPVVLVSFSLTASR